jgi:hypothetical protein
MGRILFLFSIGLFFLSNPCRSDEFGTATSVGDGTLSQTLSLSKRIREPKAEESRSINLAYTLTRNEVGSTTGSSSDAFNYTHSLSTSYSVSGKIKRGLSGSFSTTPAENLSSFGGTGFFSKTFELGTRVDEEEEEESYLPTLGFRGAAGYQHYTQTVSGISGPQRRGSQRKRPRTQDQSIGRVSLDFTVNFDPFEWFGIYGAYTRYLYTRNVSNFIDVLDDPRAIASGAAEFSTTLSGFSSSEVEAGADFSLPWDVSLNVSKSIATNETTSVLTHSYSVEFTKDWGKKWTTGVGADRFVSEGSLLDLYNVSLSYSF